MQSAAWRLLDHSVANAAQHVAQLLPARPTRCVGRVSDVRQVRLADKQDAFFLPRAGNVNKPPWARRSKTALSTFFSRYSHITSALAAALLVLLAAAARAGIVAPGLCVTVNGLDRLGKRRVILAGKLFLVSFLAFLSLAEALGSRIASFRHFVVPFPATAVALQSGILDGWELTDPSARATSIED